MHSRTIAVLAALGASVAAAQSPPAETSEQITVDGRPEPRFRSGTLFISPMGEPFRDGDHPEQAWFASVDANRDGRITRGEFIADAMRFFAALDVYHNHAIGPAEIDRYEQDIAPEIGAGGSSDFGSGPPRERGGRPPGGSRHGDGPPGGGMRGGGGGGGPPSGGGAKPGYMYHASGAGRFGYIATPEPITAADTDLNRSVTDKEFIEAAGRRFALIDANGDGTVTAKELPKLAAPRFRRGRDRPPPTATD